MQRMNHKYLACSAEALGSQDVASVALFLLCQVSERSWLAQTQALAMTITVLVPAASPQTVEQ